MFSVLGGFIGGASCTTEECRKNDSTKRFFWIVGPALLSCICAVCKFCYSSDKTELLQDHLTFVSVQNTQNTKEDIVNLFQSGLWSSRYFQDKSWHGPHQLSLSFDPQSMKVIGTGIDDVGNFTIDGIYSFDTNRIGLTKTYVRGTGDKKRNLGHQVIIQLTWNTNNHQFEGKWFIMLPNYQRTDDFELKFHELPSNV